MVDESDLFLEGVQSFRQTYTPTIPNLISDLNLETFLED